MVSQTRKKRPERKRAAGAAVVLAALALTVAPTGETAAAGERVAVVKSKRACPAGKKGARCRKRVRCGRRLASRRHKSCRSQRRKRAESPVAPAPQPGNPGSTPPPGGSSPHAPPPALGRSMSVTAREFYFTTSRAVLAAGSQTIELRNWGEDPHNLVISPNDGSHSPLVTWEDQDPGTFVVKDTALGPGSYLLWCSLNGHEAAGMATTIRVDP